MLTGTGVSGSDARLEDGDAKAWGILVCLCGFFFFF